MTALESILHKYRAASQSEREKGTYFEELIRTYFRFESSYANLYSDVWLFADWAREIGTPEFGISAKDTGIDLVAKTLGTDEYHAIQCKCYDPAYRVMKADIDSFFTASGKKCFTQRIIVTTTSDWSDNAENALTGQHPPVLKIDLQDLERSQIDWARYQPSKPPALRPRKQLRPHQSTAKTKVALGFQSADRGKLIMACGTGKTFTSLKIAEEIAGPGKLVLFLVPSLNLLSQSLTEWTQESAIPLHSFAVCSDAEVGKKRDKDDDIVETFAHELRYPATTDPRRLAIEVAKRHDAQHLSVIFSTYHSLDVLSRAQQQFGLPPIDLVICDEAHRTTGATFENDDKESNFVRVHDNTFLAAAKRLYMTATPRIYADSAKAQAEKDNIAICSMDDEALYGTQFHVITFSEAVELKLLTDYKVLVLTISEDHVSSRLQDLLKDENNQLKVDDAARIIGCWKALSKQGLSSDLALDPNPMKRAVAFCQVIEKQKGGKSHKVSSKQIAGMFQAVVDAYQQADDSDNDLLCEAAHVDGSMNAAEKDAKLTWLKAEPPANTCRILSNVRCLSEGVDVPALDAVLFLTPRNSQVDVVQSVGRVMRTAPGKKLGYVILPVVIPSGIEPHEALNDNKVYKVVWDVLQALRSHDDRFDAFINKLDLIGKDSRKMEVIAITDKIAKKSRTPTPSPGKDAKGSSAISEDTPTPYKVTVQPELKFEVGELERALNAKLVKKCGNRNHWEDWANDIAKIATTHISRISAIIGNPANLTEVAAFNAFANATAPAADTYTRRDGISDAGLAHFQAAYPAKGEGTTITKEDLFYYIYGLLHSPDYRTRYADNLGKELPRIPAVKRFADFKAFSKAGRDLAHWHLNYETIAACDRVTLDTGKHALKSLQPAHFRVEKMKFAKVRDPETNKSVNDKSTVIYNAHITIRNIPEDAYAYIINGKPALEWVMERQAVTTDKDSGIVNDANLWATETMNNPRYPLDLFLRIITVSLETNRIVASLPPLDLP